VRTVDVAPLGQSERDVGHRSPAVLGYAPQDQGSENRRRRLSIAERGMSRGDVQLESLDQPSQRRRLPGRQPQHQAAECCRVEDRMLEWARQAAADDPGVEGVVRVLDESGSAREVEEGAARIRKLRGVGNHLAIDLMAAARVGIDRRARMDERVEERERTPEVEAFSADLEDEKWAVAGRLDVERHILDGFE
jgi:hypothetical protein